MVHVYPIEMKVTHHIDEQSGQHQYTPYHYSHQLSQPLHCTIDCILSFLIFCFMHLMTITLDYKLHSVLNINCIINYDT